MIKRGQGFGHRQTVSLPIMSSLMDDWFIFVILISNIIAAVAAAALFHDKGRGFWNGFVYGLLLGWIVVVFALFMSSDQEGINERKFKRGQIGRCPNCEEYIRLDSTECRYCRQAVSSGTIILQRNEPGRGMPP